MQSGSLDTSPEKERATPATVALQVEDAKETLQENIDKLHQQNVNAADVNDFDPITPGTPVQIRQASWWGRFKTQLIIAAVAAFLILIGIFAIFYRQSIEQKNTFSTVSRG